MSANETALINEKHDPSAYYDCTLSTLQAKFSSLSRATVRIHALKGVANDTNDKISNKSVSLTFNVKPNGKVVCIKSVSLNQYNQYDIYGFAKKTTPVTLTEGDIRSRLLKNGLVPALAVNVTVGEACCYLGEIYLPWIATTTVGNIFALPLHRRSESVEECASESAAQNKVYEHVIIYLEFFAALEPKIEELKTFIDYPIITFRTHRKVDIDIECILGFPSLVRNSSRKFGIECLLTSSCVSSTIVCDSDSPIQRSKNSEILAIQQKMSLTSTSFGVDILRINVFDYGISSPASDKLVGYVSIPLSTILSVNKNAHIKHTAWLSVVDEKRKIITTRQCEWTILMKVSCGPEEIINKDDDCVMLSSQIRHDSQSGTDAAPTTYDPPVRGRSVSSDPMTPTWSVSEQQGVTSTLPTEIRNNVKTAASVSGQLMCCIQGLILTKNSDISLCKNDVICADILVAPEGIKKSLSTAANFVRLHDTSDTSDASVEIGEFLIEWNKSFDVAITWSSTQRFVGMMKLMLTVQKKGESVPNASKRGGLPIGSVSLDWTSIVAVPSTILMCKLPVTGTADKKLVMGWLFLGVKFLCVNGSTFPTMIANTTSDYGDYNGQQSSTRRARDGIQGTSHQQTQVSMSELLETCYTNWGETCRSLTESDDNYSSDTLKVIELQIHVNLGTLTLQDLSSITLSESNTGVILRLKTGNMTRDVNFSITPQTRSWNADNSDVLLSCKFHNNQACLVEFILFTSENVAGFATVLLPASRMVNGFVTDLTIPFRDSGGCRMGMLPMKCQSTANTSVQALPSHELVLRFDSGSVSDPTCRFPIEPFFECSLQSGAGEEVSVRRTQYYSPSGVDGALNLVCRLPLSSNESAALDSAKLTVVCRDACRPGFPEVCRARLTLPSTLSNAGESVELWANLFPVNMSAVTSTTDGGGRVRILATVEAKGAGGLLASAIMTSDSQSTKDTSMIDEAVGRVLLWSPVTLKQEATSKSIPVMSRINAVRLAVVRGGDEDSMLTSYLPGSGELAYCDLSTTTQISEATGEVEEIYFGGVSVVGGNNNICVAVTAGSSTASSAPPMLGSFPTLASTSSSASLNDLSPVTVVLQGSSHQVIPSKLTNQMQHSAVRLKVNTCFVPFVRGRLQIRYTDFKLTESIPGISGTRGGSNMGAFLRFAVGNTGNAYSCELDMSPPVDSAPVSPARRPVRPGGSTSPQPSMASTRKSVGRSRSASRTGATPGRPKMRTQSASRTFRAAPLPPSERKPETPHAISEGSEKGLEFAVDTHTALCLRNICETGSRCEESMALSIRLVSFQTNASSTRMTNLGSDRIDTAPLYYAALRSATDIGGSSEGQAVEPGASAWIRKQVNLKDTTTGRIIARVTVAVRFILEAVSVDIAGSLRGGARDSSPADGDKLRRELALKQAFQLADADGSGEISVSELVAVMRKITAQQQTVKSRSDGTSESLLLSLLSGFDDDLPVAKQNIADQQRAIDNAVMRIFQKFDLDGSGSLSWWEWKQIVSVTSLVKTPDSSGPIDPADPLVVAMLAASDALSSSSARTYNDGPMTLSDELALVNDARGGTLRGLFGLDDASLCDSVAVDEALKLPPGKAVSRLQDMVRSLRQSRSRLTDRLEKALTMSASPTDANMRFSGAAVSGTPAEMGKPTTDRLREVEEEARRMRELFELERNRSTSLENELELYRGTVALGVKDRDARERQFRMAQQGLQSEIEIHTTDISHRKLIYRTQLRARFMINSYIRKFIRRRRLRIQKAKTLLFAYLVRFLLSRRKRHSGQRKRNAFASRIQKVYRGRLGRRRVQRILRAVLRLQTTFRKHLAIKQLKQLKMDKTYREMRELEVKAVTLLQSRIRAWRSRIHVKKLRSVKLKLLQEQQIASTIVLTGIQGKQQREQMLVQIRNLRQDNAAMHIQSAMQKLVQRKRLEQATLREKTERESALRIQTAARGLLGRAEGQKRKKKKEQLLAQQRAVREVAAVTLQSVARSMIARPIVRQAQRAKASALAAIKQAEMEALAKEQARQAQAAILIQCVGRGLLARKEALGLLARKEALEALEALAKKRNANVSAASDVCQTLIDKSECRTAFNLLKNNLIAFRETKAAETIQTTAIRYLDRKAKAKLRYIEQEDCWLECVKSVGHVVEEPRRDSRDEYYRGVVVRADPTQNQIWVQFDSIDHPSNTQQPLQYSFHDPNIRIFKSSSKKLLLGKCHIDLCSPVIAEDEEPLSENQKPVFNESIIGFRVEFGIDAIVDGDESVEEEETSENEMFLEGQVVGIGSLMATDKIIEVCLMNELDQMEVKQVYYKLVESWFPKGIVSQVGTPKPPLIELRHYRVEVEDESQQSRQEEGQSQRRSSNGECEVLPGDIVAVDTVKRTFTVRYESAETSLSTNTSDEVVMDYDKLDVDIVWFALHKIYTY